MKDQHFNESLAALREKIDGLPAAEQKRLLALYEDTKIRHEEIKENSRAARESLVKFQENMDHLVLQMRTLNDKLQDMRFKAKLVLFDIEATRREKGDANT